MSHARGRKPAVPLPVRSRHRRFPGRLGCGSSAPVTGPPPRSPPGAGCHPIRIAGAPATPSPASAPRPFRPEQPAHHAAPADAEGRSPVTPPPAALADRSPGRRTARPGRSATDQARPADRRIAAERRGPIEARGHRAARGPGGGRGPRASPRPPFRARPDPGAAAKIARPRPRRGPRSAAFGRPAGGTAGWLRVTARPGSRGEAPRVNPEVSGSGGPVASCPRRSKGRAGPSAGSPASRFAPPSAEARDHRRPSRVPTGPVSSPRSARSRPTSRSGMPGATPRVVDGPALVGRWRPALRRLLGLTIRSFSSLSARRASARVARDPPVRIPIPAGPIDGRSRAGRGAVRRRERGPFGTVPAHGPPSFAAERRRDR